MEGDVLAGGGGGVQGGGAGFPPVGNDKDRGEKGGERGSASGCAPSPHTSLDVLGLEEKVEGTHPQQASQSDFWMSGFLKA